MDANRWDQISTLVDELAGRPKSERDELIDRAVGSDAEMRAEVESLLRALDADGALLDNPLSMVAAMAPGSDDPMIGTQLGDWTVAARIARGGMGLVYRAERDMDDVRQEAALKLLPPEMANPEGIRRFVRERKILAGLDHPSICRMLDGGVTPAGQPYLLMPFLSGALPIDRHCFERQLPIAQRVALLKQACDAVQYLHQNLIIHGDIKPGNVVVTSDGRVQILDFGIARLIRPHGDKHGETTVSPSGQMLTPAYAAPEQLRGERPNTSSDIYALGVLMYQVLCGEPPLVLPEGDFLSLLTTVSETPPRKLSAVSDFEAGAVPAKLLRGDLDTIAAKCLEKAPARRYATADALAGDLHAWETGEPVSAHPPSLSYRLRLSVRRRPLAFALSGFAVVSLIGAVASLAFIVQQQRLHAASLERERDRAEATANFMESLFEQASPFSSGRASISTEDLIDRGYEQLVQNTEMTERDRAAALNVMGRLYRILGQYDKAGNALNGAVEAGARSTNMDRLTQARSYIELANLQFRAGNDFNAMADAARHAIALLGNDTQRELVMADDARNTLAMALRRLGQPEEAEQVLRRLIASKAQRINGDPAQAHSLNVSTQALAESLVSQGKFDQARVYFDQAIAGFRRDAGDSNPATAYALQAFGRFLTDIDDYSAADAAFEESANIAKTALPAGHPFVGALQAQIGILRGKQNRADDAVTHFAQSMDILAAKLPPGHDRLNYVGNLMSEQWRAAGLCDQAPSSRFRQSAWAVEVNRAAEAACAVE